MKIKLAAAFLVLITGMAFSVPGSREFLYRTFFYEQSEINGCKTTLIAESFFDTIQNILMETENPIDSYLAYKVYGVFGSNYLLVLNDGQSTKIFAAASNGYSFRETSADVGRNVLKEIKKMDLGDVKDHFGGDMSHGSCEQIRSLEKGKVHEFALMNSSGGINTAEGHIKSTLKDMLINELKQYHNPDNIFYREYGEMDITQIEEVNKAHIEFYDKHIEKQKQDMFFELMMAQ